MSTHQILIASYAKDFVWLEPNLKSLRKFCEGFLPPVISVDGTDFFAAQRLVARIYPEARVVQKDGPRGQGFLRAQISMMMGDVLCPDADYVYLLGSDCMAFRKLTPEVYWFQGLPVMLYNSYAELGNMDAVGMWQGSTEEVLGFCCPNETMRRLPLIYPKQLFPAVRRHVEARHNRGFEEYIYKKGHPLSESNILGCYALKFMPEVYTWLHASPSDPGYVKYRTPESDSVIQWWSHGGMNCPAGIDLEYAPGKRTKGRLPGDVIREILGNDF